MSRRGLRVDDPAALAEGVRSIDAAARAAAALEAEVSLADDRSEGWYAQAADALEQLHERFPGLHHRDAYLAPSTLSPGARRTLSTSERGPRSDMTTLLSWDERIACFRRRQRWAVALLVLAVVVWLVGRHPLGVPAVVGVLLLLVLGYAWALIAALAFLGVAKMCGGTPGSRRRAGVRR